MGSAAVEPFSLLQEIFAWRLVKTGNNGMGTSRPYPTSGQGDFAVSALERGKEKGDRPQAHVPCVCPSAVCAFTSHSGFATQDRSYMQIRPCPHQPIHQPAPSALQLAPYGENSAKVTTSHKRRSRSKAPSWCIDLVHSYVRFNQPRKP